METTQNLKTSDAWRLAISLSCADVQRMILVIKDLCIGIGKVIYTITALGLMMSENNDGIALNVIGILMLLFAGLKSQAKNEEK